MIMMMGYLSPIVIMASLATADPVLRYTMDSCNTLEPTYVSENWQYPGGDISSQDTELGLFDSPKKSRDKNPPYTIQLGFNQYRRNREYTVRVETSEYYDAVILQARAKDQEDGNATLVGWFVTIPAITKHLHCLGKRKSSVVDKGRPVKLGNLTFTWRAPPTDYGPIKFTASIVSGEEFTVVKTKQISFNAFPVSIRGCGREMSCFRQCTTSPTCPPDESSFMVVMYLSRNREEVVISMGGIVEDQQKYVAVGFGDDKKDLQSMDVCACYRDGKDIRLGHYLVENKLNHPYLHRSELTLDGSDMDLRTNFIWCQFRRPVRPDSIWDLDLSQPMFHFYFHGPKNGSMIYLPEMEMVWSSKMRRNFSEITNEIMFSGKASTSIVTHPISALLVTLTATLFVVI